MSESGVPYVQPGAVTIKHFGRRVVLNVGGSIAYVTPEQCARLREDLERAEAEARGVQVAAAPGEWAAQ